MVRRLTVVSVLGCIMAVMWGITVVAMESSLSTVLDTMTLEKWEKERVDIREKVISLMGGFPEKTPLNARVIKKEDKGSYFQEKIVFESEPGEIIPAYILVPKDLENPAPAVYCHHQHGGQFHLGKAEVTGLQGDPEQSYAKELAERGYITFAPDAKCFEERSAMDGRDYELFEFTRLLLLGDSLRRRMCWDVIRGIDYLYTRPEIDHNRIGMIGHSMGGDNTMFAAAFDERIKVSVSSCGFSTFKLMLEQKKRGGYGLYIPGMLKEGMDIPEIVSLIAPRPYLIMARTQDQIYSSEGVRHVHETAKKIYALYGKDNALDLSMYEGQHGLDRVMREEAYKWFDKWLRGK